MPDNTKKSPVPTPLAVVLSGVSGVLMTLAMPGFDVPYLGWVAMVPLLVVLISAPRFIYLLAMPFSLVFLVGVHNWYPEIFPLALGISR